MDPVTAGTVISTGAQFLGGLFGKKKKGPTAADQLNIQANSIRNNMAATMQAAKENGVHPLVALGMPPSGGPSFSVGGEDNSAVGDMISDVGQNIGSAVARSQSPEQRLTQSVISKQAVERGDLENELLKTQIASMRASMSPAIPTSNAGEMIAGQADSGTDYLNNQLIKHENSEGKEAGSPSSWTTVKTKSGLDIMLPSKDFQDRAEDIPLIGWEWLLKNRAPELVRVLREMKFGRELKNPYMKGGK